MPDYLRRVILRPYRKGAGPSFTLTTWEAGTGLFAGFYKERLRYRLTQREGNKRRVLFQGEDFGCSPMHAIDSDDTVRSLLGFLTLRPGDTDAEYFEDYTDAQREFCDEHAEALAWEVCQRFGEE